MDEAEDQAALLPGGAPPNGKSRPNALKGNAYNVYAKILHLLVAALFLSTILLAFKVRQLVSSQVAPLYCTYALRRIMHKYTVDRCNNSPCQPPDQIRNSQLS